MQDLTCHLRMSPENDPDRDCEAMHMAGAETRLHAGKAGTMMLMFAVSLKSALSLKFQLAQEFAPWLAEANAASHPYSHPPFISSSCCCSSMIFYHYILTLSSSILMEQCGK